MRHSETQYAKGPEGRVAYQVVGDGPFDLVFVPGWTGNVDVMWEEPSLARFLHRLASFSRLLCFDKRGTGVSDPVPLAAPPTLEQWMDDIRTVMDAVGSERAALFGHGMGGGQMSMLFAATYPERTSALVLLDTWARMVADVDYPYGPPVESSTVESRNEFVESAAKTWGTVENVQGIAPSAAHDERFLRWYARYQRLSISPGPLATILTTAFETDVRGVLASIRVPTLVVHRVGNRFAPVAHGRYLAERIAGARYVELSGEDYVFHTGDTETMLGEVEEFLTGTRSAAEYDRVLATVLFVDVVGSTDHAARVGDRAWRALLDTYVGIARQEIERHRGRHVGTAGDGILATFDGPARAIRSACAMNRAVRDLGIEIRAGLHTGEIELTGEDIGGIAVHIGARVIASAAPSEVLVSSTVKDLVAGSGIRFTDRGIRTLKGVPGEWRLYAADDPQAT
jgi:class 3 adenylate cyclase